MNKHYGSSFDSFLEEENIFNEVEAIAIKKYISILIINKMKEDSISKTKLAQMMHTSRSSVNRLIDPNNISITLKTMEKAATVLGKKLKIELV